MGTSEVLFWLPSETLDWTGHPLGTPHQGFQSPWNPGCYLGGGNWAFKEDVLALGSEPKWGRLNPETCDHRAGGGGEGQCLSSLASP